MNKKEILRRIEEWKAAQKESERLHERISEKGISEIEKAKRDGAYLHHLVNVLIPAEQRLKETE